MYVVAKPYTDPGILLQPVRGQVMGTPVQPLVAIVRLANRIAELEAISAMQAEAYEARIAELEKLVPKKRQDK